VGFVTVLVFEEFVIATAIQRQKEGINELIIKEALSQRRLAIVNFLCIFMRR
jgi:hypothetical protein